MVVHLVRPGPVVNADLRTRRPDWNWTYEPRSVRIRIEERAL